MTFEEILPEIRKGRRFRATACLSWQTIEETSYLLSFVLNPKISFELEPLPEKKVEVTVASISRAWDKAANEAFYRGTYKVNVTLLCKYLGLDE